MTARRAIYPASFNPPTIAHLAISEAAMEQRRLDVVVWSLSVVGLGKEYLTEGSLQHRLEVLETIASSRDWLEIQVTEHQLLVDIAQGFDVLIMGADKWHQIQEDHWYTSAAHKAESLQRLPELAIAPRPPDWIPEDLELSVPGVSAVSSTAARNGAVEHMLPEARASGYWA